MSVKDKIIQLKTELPENCTLVAVSKTKPCELILEGLESGHKDFGENKVQELVSKYEQLPKDIKWHMIGHLQRNKVKYIAPFVHLIHGVDSMKLLKEVNKQAEKHNRIISCLLQMHIAVEETKFGLNQEELSDILTGHELTQLTHVKIVGLMGMATNTNDESRVCSEFEGLKALFDSIQTLKQISNVEIKHLSMGMSGDYPLALKSGSNMIRVGSKLFGERTPNP
jgi:pyridoxal phosphate enzyme (YggS family)